MDPGFEELCDDGNTLGGDGCSADCRSDESCGNGVIDRVAGETCEDGNIVERDGCLDCTATEIRLSTTALVDRTNPKAVVFGDGSSLALWSRLVDLGASWTKRLVGQRFAADGSRDGTELELGPTSDSYLDVFDVASSSAGELIVLWSEQNRIVAQRYDPWGLALGAPVDIVPLTNSTYCRGSVAMTDDGRFVVAYEDSVYPDHQVFLRVFDSASLPLTDATVVVTTEAIWEPEVAVTNADELIVVWAQRGDVADGYGVAARRYDMDGVALAPQFFVSSSQAGDQIDPHVASAGNGLFTVVWTQRGGGPQLQDIYARRFDAAGVPVGPDFRLNEFTWYDQHATSLSMAQDGRFVVAWLSYAQSSDDWDVYARVFDPFGAPLSAEIAVNHFTEDDQRGPVVAINASGELVVAWTNYSSVSGEDDVFGRRYAADGTPLVLGP